MLLVLVLLNTTLFGKSLGVIGRAFPIAEMSFLTLINERMNALSKDGGLEQINQDFIQRASRHTNRPKYQHLKRTEITKTHYYNPSVKLTQTLVDHRGQILYPVGTHVNALEQLPSYRPCWFFFNGDDKAQLKFIQHQADRCQNPKLILTEGSIFDTEKALNDVIYFDQNGRIASKLKLTHVPAIVTRENSRLKITEYAIKGSGDEV